MGTSAAVEIKSADGLLTRLEVGPSEQMLAPGFITDGVILDETRL